MQCNKCWCWFWLWIKCNFIWNAVSVYMDEFTDTIQKCTSKCVRQLLKFKWFIPTDMQLMRAVSKHMSVYINYNNYHCTTLKHCYQPHNNYRSICENMWSPHWNSLRTALSVYLKPLSLVDFWTTPHSLFSNASSLRATQVVIVVKATFPFIGILCGCAYMAVLNWKWKS